MEIFGIGMPEFLIILIVILIFVGPDRLPELARTVGGWVREVRGLTNEATSVWREAMEVPETIKSTISNGSKALRGNPTPVPYQAPPQSLPTVEIGRPSSARPVPFTAPPGPPPPASIDALAYPAPFAPDAAPVTSPQDNHLDYPAPFEPRQT